MSAAVSERGMRIRVQVDTDLLTDAMVLRVLPSHTISQLLTMVKGTYDQWHAFPVYEFEIRQTDEKELPYSPDATVASLKKSDLVVVESAASKARRLEELRKKEEEKRLQEELARLKEEKRRQQILELTEIGDCWTLENNVQSLEVPLEEGGLLVRNRGSLEQWCPIHRVRPILAQGKSWFSIKILKDPPTTNTWRFSVGVIPLSFKVNAERRWIGSQKSWGYIAGNGGKCFNTGKMEAYGATYAEGDVIGVLLDFTAGTIEFYKNGVSQGIAFKNLVGPVYPAVSLTAKGAEVQLCNEYPDELKAVIELNDKLEQERMNRWKHISSEEFHETRLKWADEGFNSWDVRFALNKDRSLFFPDAKVCEVLNEGSGDKWRSVRSIGTYSSGVCFFEFVMEKDPPTVNSWRICVGVVPSSFRSDGARIWVGAQGSWGYIAGTGGKVYNSGQSVAYGETFEQGDVIGVLLNFDESTIEFFKNGVSQGVAFRNLVGPVHAAISLTGTDAVVKLRNVDVGDVEKYREMAMEKASKLSSVITNYGNVWDPKKCSKDLTIDEDGIRVLNVGSGNKWRAVASLLPYSNGRRYFEVIIKENPSSSNSWRICVGVIPRSFDFTNSKVWVGAQKSWSYIGGTGGKCHNSGKSVSYGAKFTKDDRVGVLMDFDNRTLEFFKNGVRQGIAFTDLVSPVFAAVSMTGTGASVVLDGAIEAQQDLIDSLFLYK